MWKFQGSSKKEVEFLLVFMKNLCNLNGAGSGPSEFQPTRAQGKSGNLFKDQGKSGKLDFLEKVREKSEKKILIHVTNF